MNIRVLVLGILLITSALFMSGCMDVLSQQKVGGFGDVESANSSSQQNTLADPRTGASGFHQGSIYATCYPACIKSKRRVLMIAIQPAVLPSASPETRMRRSSVRRPAGSIWKISKIPDCYAFYSPF